MQFFKSSLLHAFAMFLFAAIVNQIVIMRACELELSRQAFAALLTGLTATILLPVLIALAFSFLPENVAKGGRTTALILLFFSILPIFDLLYFRATFSRFSWSVWHDLNFYAIKASLLEIIFHSSHIPAVGLLLAVITTASLTYKYGGGACPKSTRTMLIRVLIALLLGRFFFPPESYQYFTNFTPSYMQTEGKNNLLRQLEKGSLKGFFTYRNPAGLAKELIKLTPEEMSSLQNLGLIPPTKSYNHEPLTKTFSKIIVVVFESLALEYFHSFNHTIPPEASSFFDALNSSYPSAQNYFTSDSPTMNGLYAMLNSRIPFNSDLAKIRKEQGFATLFKKNHGGKTIFIRGVSKFYGGENLLLKAIQGFDTILAYEDLKMEAKEPPFYDWGFHDDVVLEKTFSLIKENSDQRFFIMCKLIDLHQPPFYCGLPADKLPKAVLEHQSPIVRSIYWANYLLKNFFDKLEKSNLIDHNTLLIITSDHYPPPAYGHAELVKGRDYDPRGRLPLIFVSKRPEIFANFRPQALSCQLDFAPTICYLGGVSVSEWFLGQNIIASYTATRAISHIDNQIRIIASDSRPVFIQINDDRTPANALEKWGYNLQAVH